MNYLYKTGLALFSLLAVLSGRAQYPVDLEIQLTGGGGSGNFAPYYIGSNNNGRVTQSSNLLLEVEASKVHEVNGRFSYTWGVDLIGGWASSVDYRRYDEVESIWRNNPRHPSRVAIQQLYGRIDYCSLFLSVGQRDPQSAMFNNQLSSGDLTRGANSRGVPEVMAGFNSFQPVPFTNGWVEIKGEISYGKFTDSDWLEDHINRYHCNICRGSYYTYKNCYLRTKSSRPLSFTVGMQVASSFGGTTTYYRNGSVTKVEHHKSGLKEFIKMIIPMAGDESFYLGSTLGSWDLMLSYKLPAQKGVVKAYLQKPWETGSGIGFLNGFDGVWGLEYQAPRSAPVDGLVVEYIDFTNQSGPIHYHDGDNPGTTLIGDADGGDDYYNNYTYNAYANYGMSMGTPFMRSPIYNTDGFMGFVDNVIRGFHIGVCGTISPRLSYRVLGGYRKGWGTSRVPRTESVHDTSLMIQGVYRPAIKGENLTVSASIAMDRGTLYGNTFGALVSVKYHTSFNIGRR